MEHCPADTRKAHHQDAFKKKLLNRLKRIEGQVRGIQKMLSDNVYCDDIITQITATRSALASVAKELFEAHLNSCILEQIQSGSPDILDELKKTIDRMTK
ncbi:MAG: metal-sensitive transcriptional regulator [Candidatus Cloacimonadaceae bacterium]|nr:metal-sensitive transcriptional regulator [Candidatus Cloacimonadaceae bacterium]MDP3113806.1 metal-sensitive transcriptional regulator [Candidatus Cloacimonadaceae bacterium]